MEYVKLGRTGLDVSHLPRLHEPMAAATGANHAWSLSEEESKPFRPIPGSPFDLFHRK